MRFIDDILNRITMYRLAVWLLSGLLVLALLFSVAGWLPFRPFDLLASVAFFLLACLAVNWLFAVMYRAPSNEESVYITALILALVVTPAASLQGLWFPFLAAAFAIASKYVLAINRKHLFNPAAMGLVLASLVTGNYASWWAGSAAMVLPVLIAGLLLTRKIRRFDLVLAFFAGALLTTLVVALRGGHALLPVFKELLWSSPLLFFGFVMFTEPATTPPTRRLRTAYGAITGVLFVPWLHWGGLYLAPESALVAANAFSYLISPKFKLVLTLIKKIPIASNAYDFVFSADRPFKFLPGQYLEWTLLHHNADNRGIRRYFTIASSPGEKEVRIGVKFYEKPSSYKQALQSLRPGDSVVASQLAGDFTLPKNPHEKLVFLAGGIGITPFASMVQYLMDTRQKRDIILFYATKNAEDLAYQELFDRAATAGLRTVYVLEDSKGAQFTHEAGRVNASLLKKYVPDWRERRFYVSGPKQMIDAFRAALLGMGVSRGRIKTDFFPGFS